MRAALSTQPSLSGSPHDLPMKTLLALLLTLSPVSDDTAAPAPPISGLPATDDTSSQGDETSTPDRRVITVSNLRFCHSSLCDPTDSAYLRGPTGPVPGADNNRAFTLVHPGDTVTWHPGDGLCQVASCDHDLRIEEGTIAGRSFGVMRSDPGVDAPAFRIPDDAEGGSVIRYFCATHGAAGMTGAFRVFPIPLLSISYPPLPG